MPAETPRPPRILVYVDASQHWLAPVRTVGDYARATDASVTILTTEWSRTKREAAFARAKGILGLPEEKVTLASRVGLVEYVLPEVSRGHDLAVVGRVGSLDFLTNRLVSVHLARRSACDVLLVRGKAERLERILVATEGARHGEADVRTAARFAKALGARVTVLHVRSEMALTDDAHDELASAAAAFLEGPSQTAEHLRKMQDLLVAEGVRGGVKVRYGTVVDEILAELSEGHHDLLVLGAHEKEGDETFYYEDISALLVRASPVSCLVVRPLEK